MSAEMVSQGTQGQVNMCEGIGIWLGILSETAYSNTRIKNWTNEL